MLTRSYLLEISDKHRLTVQQRTVLMLRLLEGKPYPEIAKNLGVSVGSCFQSLHQIYDRFDIEGKTKGKEEKLRHLLEAEQPLRRELEGLKSCIYEACKDRLTKVNLNQNKMLDCVALSFAETIRRQIEKLATEPSTIVIPVTYYPQVLVDLQTEPYNCVIKAVTIPKNELSIFLDKHISPSIFECTQPSSVRVFTFFNEGDLEQYIDIVIQHARFYQVSVITYQELMSLECIRKNKPKPSSGKGSYYSRDAGIMTYTDGEQVLIEYGREISGGINRIKTVNFIADRQEIEKYEYILGSSEDPTSIIGRAISINQLVDFKTLDINQTRIDLMAQLIERLDF